MDNRNYYHDYLMHYGVLGMKWGVRRYQNPDGTLTAAGKKRATRNELRETRDKIFDKEREKLRKEYGIEDKKKQAIAYGQKHKLDMDDGGGGSQKAGDKYMSMWDEIETLERRAYDNANQRARQYVVDKYGEKTVKSVTRADNAKALALVGAFLAVPIAAGAVTYHDLRK